jgi:glycosyltransferase involved in cell wall biosynthesis
MSVVDVSVVITTKDEEKNIENCLRSIRQQNYPQDKIEIIVVDNNSKDSTVETAKTFTDKVYNKGPERSAQRNLGVKEAVGKYILYLDADMILSEDVIKECIEKCENEDNIALYVPERIIGGGFWIKVRDFERSFYNATCIDAVRFTRRDKFLEIGGFDENLAGPEDWDFDRRVKNAGKVGIIDVPLYHNEGIFSLRRHLKKKSYYSRSFDKYVNKWGTNDRIVKKQLGFWYRYFGVFVQNGRWKRLVKHPILAIVTYFLKLLVGMRFACKWR